jgi:hypothetical protein
MTEETNVTAEASAEAIETQVIYGPEGQKIVIPVQDYRVTVLTEFTLKGPVSNSDEDIKKLERLIWENMPGGNIGENFFVQLPRGFRDIEVTVKADDLKTYLAAKAAFEAAQAPAGLVVEEPQVENVEAAQ